MRPAPTDTETPAAATLARAKSALPAGGFIDCAMSQSREMIQPVCARGSRGACPRGAARLVNADGRRVEERESRKQTPPNPRSIEDGVRGLVHHSADSSSPFGFPQDGAVLRSSLSGWFL